jgi:predicted transposase YbfD/YdcC
MPKPKSINKEFLELSKAIDVKQFAESVCGAFHGFIDYRRDGKIFYPAWYIILGTLSGYLAGCDNIQDVAGFMKMKNQWFAELLHTPVKAPSYNVIWTFFVCTKLDEFKRILKQWFSLLPSELREQLLVLDGKRIKGASTGTALTHVVELFASESQITLYQERVPDKKNELAALAPILEAVDVEGALLSMDAMFTQKANAALIIDKKADYLMGLKGNQSNLLDEIQYYFEDAAKANFEGVKHDFYHHEESGHGREEKRTIQVVSDLEEWLLQIEDWKGLKTAIEVVSERAVDGKIEICTQYYICSRIGSAMDFGGWIRGQWSIENNLHWVADVVFREDDATNKVGYSAENLTLVRRLAMNIVNLFDPSAGMAAARRFATHEPEYLKGMLIKVFSKIVKSF